MNIKKKKLGDIATIIDGDRGNNYPKQNEFSPSGYCLFLNAGNVTANGFVFDDNSYITQEKDALLRKGRLSRGDIVYTTRGTIGNVAYYSNTIPYEHLRINSGMVILRVNVVEANAAFLYQYLKSAKVREYFLSFKTGSAQPQLPIKNFSAIEIDLPDLPTQHRIASILSAYDDLIENNRRQIKLLEEAAQRLYREWFVELHFPGHEGVKVVDGVPEGWTVTTASEVTNVLRRGISPNYDETARLSVISQKCIRQYMVDMNQVRRQSKSFDSSMGLLDSDTVICSTGTGTLGRVGKVFGNHPNCTFDSHVTLVRTNGTVGKHYLNLRMYELREYFDSCKTGSTNQTELSRSIVQNVKVYIADSHTQQIFEKIEEAYHQKMMICQHQIQLLTETRDRLLPKLMNGEMEV